MQFNEFIHKKTIHTSVFAFPLETIHRQGSLTSLARTVGKVTWLFLKMGHVTFFRSHVNLKKSRDGMFQNILEISGMVWYILESSGMVWNIL